MDFFEVVKDIGSLLTVVLGSVSLAGVINKLQHKRYKEWFDEHLEEMRKNDKKKTEEITEIKNTLDNFEKRFDSLETKVDSLEKRFEKRFDVVEDFNAEICRNVIKDIYYKYNKTQKIPLYERKMADSLYKIYSEQFHQNSYGQLLYQEICKWEIDQ